ncbi:hypothetical protein Bhyg_03382, partial [Pseudolycoriella hygida]
MEDAYGIGIENRYAQLLDSEDNDPQAILKNVKKAKKAAKKLAGKENKTDDLTEETKAKFVAPGKKGKQSDDELSRKETKNIQSNGKTNGFRETKNDVDRDRSNGIRKNNETREQRNYRRNNDGNNLESNDQTMQEQGAPQSRGPRTFNGNRNNERGNRTYNGNRNSGSGSSETSPESGRPQSRGYRNGRNNDYGNVQEMDQNQHYNNQRDRDENRNSRRQAVEKREGGGAHNWGSHKQDIEDLSPSEEVKDDENSVENVKNEEASEQVVEQVFLTLDEYKKQLGERAKPVFNTRKAGEGEDKKKWKNLVALEKKREDSKNEEEMILDMSQWPQRKRRIRSIKDINVRFNEAKSPGFNNFRRRNRNNMNGRSNDD